MDKKYYAVKCKCGHTGTRMYYIPITFAVVANDAKEAAKKARNIPRCKHHHKDCVLDVKEISYTDYEELIKNNKNDPYLNCSSIQEQRKYDLNERFVLDPHYIESIKNRENNEQIHQIFYGKTKIKNPKKYFRNYYYEEVVAW